jgi:uncharacterized protein YbaR (Trm112 family)
MKPELMTVLACPKCKEALGLSTEEEDPSTGEVLQGTLECTACGSLYRIEDGIPDLRPPEDI